MTTRTYRTVEGEVFPWQSQREQYPASHDPGFVLQVVEVDSHPVECLLMYDDDRELVGILNRYPSGYPGLEEPMAINIWVDPARQRRGLGTRLMAEGERRWGPYDWDAQQVTSAGHGLFEAYRNAPQPKDRSSVLSGLETQGGKRTMNRASRRAENKGSKQMASRNAGVALDPQAKIKLDPPEQAGTISVAEAAEIRERTRLLEAQQKLLTEKQDEVNDIAKMATLLRMESMAYVKNLCQDRGLDLRDDYNVQSESGIIWRTASAPPAILEDTAPAPVEDLAGANGKDEK